MHASEQFLDMSKVFGPGWRQTLEVLRCRYTFRNDFGFEDFWSAGFEDFWLTVMVMMVHWVSVI
jgi:hypothetical protein